MTLRIESRGGKLVIDIRTRGPDGNPIRERRNAPDGVTSPSGAKRWAEARQKYLAQNGRELEVKEVPTFSDFGPRWMKDYSRANGNKPSTLDTKETILRKHLYPVLGSLRLDRIGELEIQRLKLHLEGMKAKTIACVLSQLATMLGSAARWGEIMRAPEIELPRFQDAEMDFYDFDEWEQLVAGARKAGPMVLAAVLLAGEAGLRRGELIALEQKSCSGGRVVVCLNEWKGKVGAPKGGKTRRIRMTERLRATVDAVRHLRGKRLLWQANGQRVKVTTLQSWMETACRRAGLPESRNLHKLRHTFCSHLAMRGATARAIQELAGHADLKTTQRYMHLSPAHVDEAIGLLEQPPPQRVEGARGEQANRDGAV